jgi:CMP-N-acetylneuraminic acid synthetase
MWNRKINPEKTLLDIAIKTSLSSDVFDKIVVTADMEKIQDILEKYKDPRLVFIFRETKLTIPSCSIVNTIEHVLNELSCTNEGISVLSYTQAPFTTTANLEEAVFTLILNDSDSSFAVEEIHTPLYRRTAYGLTPINNLGDFRSDFDIVYSDASTSLATKNNNIKTGSIWGTKIVNFIIPKEEAFFIHTKRDFEIAKKILEKF